MIIELNSELDESKFNKTNLYYHGVTRSHIDEYKHDLRFSGITKLNDRLKKYNEIGDILSKARAYSPFSDKRIVGFINKQNRVVKFDRQYGDFVVFKGDDTITLHKRTERSFKSNLRRDFKEELPENQNKETNNE